ncbi:AMP-binding protein [Modestobacter sp. NPDC049651]|uniref:AMP-binding protein n=1 Tax=unclassified Modestobacter TaxID=2643866 RepID=UPI0033F6EDF5
MLTTSELEHQTRADPRLFAGITRQRSEGTTDLGEFLAAHRGEVPPPVSLGPDDVAFLTYTSVTTGVPEGAMNTHRNVVFTAQVYRDWARAGRDGTASCPLCVLVTGLGLLPMPAGSATPGTAVTPPVVAGSNATRSTGDASQDDAARLRVRVDELVPFGHRDQPQRGSLTRSASTAVPGSRHRRRRHPRGGLVEPGRVRARFHHRHG